MRALQDYEAVIGVEVHVELATRSKLFCSCPTAFGAEPNTQCCPICSGLPGAMPSLNRKAVEYAVISGLSTNCTIAPISRMDRKNYFYPDLPKAYQISQLRFPVCTGGHIEITADGKPKRIGITRIHIEEDAGKLIHDPQKGTLVDYNRSGVPLIELVSEPQLSSAEETVAFLKKLRNILIFAGVTEGRMNEGGLRCDVNISVKPRGERSLGERTEIKNLNSFAFICKAIEYEYARQVEVLRGGGRISRETRRFDEKRTVTLPMRAKEEAADYRFFPEPDIPPLSLAPIIERHERGELDIPDLVRLQNDYKEHYGISESDAELLTSRRSLSTLFDTLAPMTRYPKLAVNLVLSELSVLIPEDTDTAAMPPKELAVLADMLGDGELNFSLARRALRTCAEKDMSARACVHSEGLFIIKDTEALRRLALEAMESAPRAVQDYISGKSSALKSLIGICMKNSGGRAEPTLLCDILTELLSDLAS